MLNRRHIREKVLKTLYAYFQSDHTEIKVGEKELFHSIDKVYEIYLMYLSLATELKDAAQNQINERKLKRLPTEEDLDPSLNFVNNRLIDALERHNDLSGKISKAKINWVGHAEMIRKIFMQFRNDEIFTNYLRNPAPSFEEDQKMLLWIYEEHIFTSEILEQLLEERSIYWLDEIGLMQAGVLKTIKSLKADDTLDFRLLPLHKEEEEDRKFATDLFRQTIAHNEQFEKEIAAKTQNWEIERVAKMDVILMKMALCELTRFPSIPVKVTLDEYIELSKDYSSPQSKNFINGILDKIVVEYRRDNKIVKAGRGLVE
jgi:N utilization substance protein B